MEFYQIDNSDYFGPVPWWTWNATIQPDEIVRQLDDFQAHGIEEFFIYANYGLEKPDFLSPEWFDMVGLVIKACELRKMKLWVYDELSWPSGTAGGRIPRDYPEYRMWNIRRYEQILAPGDKARSATSDGSELIWGGVFDRGRRLQQIFAADEEVRNDSGEELHAVMLRREIIRSVFFHNIGTEGTWNQEGTLDTLSFDGVRCWMGIIHEEYRKRFSQYFGKVVKGFFFDEPTMAALDRTHVLPWTGDLEDAFAKRYGYLCCPLLWTLFDEADGAWQFRYDFWRLAGERFGEAFAGQLAKWCAENNLLLTGHGWPEEPACQRLMVNMNGDLYYQQRHLQVPGTDILRAETAYTEFSDLVKDHRGWPRNYLFSAKHPVSTARYNGARRTMVETSGICGRNSNLAEQRIVYDFLFAMGLNLINPAVAYSLHDFRKNASCNDRAMPFWRYYRTLSQYIERMSHFNSRGQVDTRIAILNPTATHLSGTTITPDISMRNETTPFAGGFDCSEAMLATLEAMSRGHRGMELLFDQVVLDGTIESDGTLNGPGASFKVIILPQCYVLDDEVQTVLSKFAAAGGKLIAVGDAPAHTVRHGRSRRRVAAIRCNAVLDYTSTDFSAQLLAMLDRFEPAKYKITGDDAKRLFSEFRIDGSWRGAFIANPDAAQRRVRLEAPELSSARIFDPGDGQLFRPEADGNIMLAGGQSMAFEWVENDPLELPPVVAAPWYLGGKKPLTTLPLEWQYAGGSANTLRCQLEVRRKEGYVIIDDDGYCPFSLQYDKEPELEIRGHFAWQGAVPEDLRLRFDGGNFKNLKVNGTAKNRVVADPVFSPQNEAVPIADCVHDGINEFTVTLLLSKWYSDRYGMMRHFTGLTHLIEAIQLAGSFGVTPDGTAGPLPDKIVPGNLGEQGFAQFGGIMKLTSEFDTESDMAKYLRFAPTRAALEATLNNEYLGISVWEPACFGLPPGLLRKHGNRLELKISNGLGNMFPRRWNGAPDAYLPFILPETELL